MLKVAARRQVEMFAERVGKRRLAADMFENPVAAPQRERNGLTEVAQNDFQPRIGVEYAADNEANGLDGGFGGKTPCHRQKREIATAIIGIVGLRDGSVRNARVEIERHVERLRPLKDAPEALVVEEGARGQPVDQRALEVVVCDRALEFVGGGLGIDRRQLGEARKARRVGAGRRVERIIRLACHRDRGVGVEYLRSRLHVRDHLHVNSRRIHVLEADLAEIIELPRWGVRGNSTRPAIAVAQLRESKNAPRRRQFFLFDWHRIPLSRFATSVPYQSCKRNAATSSLLSTNKEAHRMAPITLRMQKKRPACSATPAASWPLRPRGGRPIAASDRAMTDDPDSFSSLLCPKFPHVVFGFLAPGGGENANPTVCLCFGLIS